MKAMPLFQKTSAGRLVVAGELALHAAMIGGLGIPVRSFSARPSQ
jgi:hypothetical protein